MRACAVLLVVAAGCAAQSIDDIHIACNADSDCPEGAWCDLQYHDNVCSTKTSPPHIVFDGFVVAGQLAQTMTVPSKTVTIGKMRFRNDGGTWTYLIVTVTGPQCTYAGSLTRGDGDMVAAGATFDGEFDVDPLAGCASPATLQIDTTASGRMFSFSTTIAITP